jgi:hypothetical protein
MRALSFPILTLKSDFNMIIMGPADLYSAGQK